jgi:heat shock protein HslJ
MIDIKRLTLLAAVSTIITACSSSSIIPEPESLSGNWLVDSIKGKPVIAKSTAQLKFDPKNRLSGSASCNNISTSYNLQQNAITIGPIATTRKMCMPALMDQEANLLQALGKVKRVQLKNGQLSMFDQQGALQLKAKKTK